METFTHIAYYMRVYGRAQSSTRNRSVRRMDAG